MNEIDERQVEDLRGVFRRREGDVVARGSTPPTVRRRVRRRQVGTVAATGLAVIALSAASIAGLRALGRPGDSRPAGPGPTTTSTVSDITITYPGSWFAADPVAIGVEPSDGERTLPSLALSLTRDDPTIQGVLGCPAMADVSPGQVVMTIQETPLALQGEAARPWPVELHAVDVGVDPTKGAASGDCYEGWTFLRSAWTAAGRSFEAVIGFAPDATSEDRDALLAAYASMTFGPRSVASTESVTLASGTAFDSTTWTLTASRQGAGICWSLDTGVSGAGSCWDGAPDVPALAVQQVAPQGAMATVMVPSDVQSVIVEAPDGVIGDIGLFPVPREWGDVDFAVIPLPGTGHGTIRFQDQQGDDLYPSQKIDWPTDTGAGPAQPAPSPGSGVDRELDWTNVNTIITAEGRFAGVPWKLEILYYKTGVRLTIGDRPEVIEPLPLKSPVVRPVDDDGFDALVLVLTNLSVDRVAISTEGVVDGRWLPASTANGDEARLWVIEMPGAGTGTLLLNGEPSGDVTWP